MLVLSLQLLLTQRQLKCLQDRLSSLSPSRALVNSFSSFEGRWWADCCCQQTCVWFVARGQVSSHWRFYLGPSAAVRWRAGDAPSLQQLPPSPSLFPKLWLRGHRKTACPLTQEGRRKKVAVTTLSWGPPKFSGSDTYERKWGNTDPDLWAVGTDSPDVI